jgi:hypothetical protein
MGLEASIVCLYEARWYCSGLLVRFEHMSSRKQFYTLILTMQH